MVLISVSAMAVIITLPTNSDDAAQTRAEQLYQRLNLLHQDAILNGWDLGVRFDDATNTYRFLRLTRDGWEGLEHRRIPTDTELDEGLTLAFELGGGVWGEKESFLEQDSLFDEDMFADIENKDTERPPQVFILSSGELTPFIVFIHPSSAAQGDENWRVVAQENGQFRLLIPGEVFDEETL